jgi:hypothetical protein
MIGGGLGRGDDVLMKGLALTIQLQLYDDS